MSWTCLPWWVYAVENEEFQAKMLGAFQEELDAGFVRSLPKHVVEIIQRNRKEVDEDVE